MTPDSTPTTGTEVHRRCPSLNSDSQRNATAAFVPEQEAASVGGPCRAGTAAGEPDADCRGDIAPGDPHPIPPRARDIDERPYLTPQDVEARLCVVDEPTATDRLDVRRGHVITSGDPHPIEQNPVTGGGRRRRNNVYCRRALDDLRTGYGGDAVRYRR